MFSKAKLSLSALLALSVALTAAPWAEAQGFRERLRERLEQRQASRQGDASQVEGLQSFTIEQGGQRRSFLVYAPSSLRQRPGAVLAFHGGNGDAERMVGIAQMRGYADQGGFLLVYPDAGGGQWNDGRIATRDEPDDIAFTRAIVNLLEQQYGLDPSRVFATGISNGGLFDYRLACDAPDLVAGIAPVAANMPDALYESCRPRQGTPVMMFSGTDDRLMPFQGGQPDLARMIERARGPLTDAMIGAPRTAEFWAGVNGCDNASSTQLQDAREDGTTVTQISYGGCEGGDVVLFQINGGGHNWPGSNFRDTRIGGHVSQDIDATAAMIRFFQRYGL